MKHIIIILLLAIVSGCTNYNAMIARIPNTEFQEVYIESNSAWGTNTISATNATVGDGVVMVEDVDINVRVLGYPQVVKLKGWIREIEE